MYILKTEYDFDSAHFLKGYDGKCSNIHGHRWKVVVNVGSETLEQEGNIRGMVVDFSKLKSDLKEMADRLDHKLIIETGSLRPKTLEVLEEEGFAIVSLPIRPTAENFAKYFYDLMTAKGYHVVETMVYETPNNYASYRGI